MRNNDRQRPPLPARLTPAERDFYVELRRLVDAAGLSFRALEESTSTTKSDSGESSFYSKSQWGRWLNGQSLPPRKAVKKLTEKLAKEDIEAEHLVTMWARAFVPNQYPQEPGTAMVRPRQLPTTPQHFIGRTTQLEALSRLVDEATESTGAVVIVIEGTAGVGKTTLANHFGHHICDRFPDGQLYVNLRGFDETGRPMTDGEALRGFLDALGVSQEVNSAAVDDQAALYRSVLAGRRVLVMLDNAREPPAAWRGCVCPRPHLLGPGTHMPHYRARPGWGACGPGAIGAGAMPIASPRAAGARLLGPGPHMPHCQPASGGRMAQPDLSRHLRDDQRRSD